MNALLLVVLLSPDFRSPDPSLAEFHLVQPAPEPPPEEEKKPSLAWKLLGWANYAAAGCVTASQYYRQERVPAYDANPDNDAARIALLTSSAIGANEASDLLYDKNREWGWVGRLASIGILGYSCGANFYQGWERQ